MQRFRLRSDLPASAALARVDREARVIRGVQVLSVGEAKGHDILIDEVTLAQAASLMGATGEVGLKSRFTHPGMCEDGMGKQLGRLRNGRVAGNQVVADLHLAEYASASPDGDLAAYIFDMAEEDPAACGLSIVFSGLPVWKNAAGIEFPAFSDNGDRLARPADATTAKPFARIAKLNAADVVDEPAATSGLLAAFSATSNEGAAKAFAVLDSFRESNGLTLSQSQVFLSRYLSARGYVPDHKERPMNLTPDRLAELCEQHPAHAPAIAKAFAAGKTEGDVIGMIAQADSAALSAKVVDLEAKLAAQIASTVELQAKHDAIAALKAGAAEDPGSVPAGGATSDAIKSEWESKDPAFRAGFWNDLEIYREAKRLEAIDQQHAGKGN